MKSMAKYFCGLLVILLAASLNARALPFNSGDLILYRVGDGGDAAGTTASTDVWLDEYSEAGSLVASMEMPTSTAGGQYALTAQGGSTSEGLLTISPNGQWIGITGYAVAPGAANPSTTSADARTVGILNVSNGQLDTSTALTDASTTSSFRSAATTDGNSIWVGGGVAGVRYATKGATTSTSIQTGVANCRQIGIYPTASQSGGQLMMGDQSGSSVRIGSIGTGLPTTSGQTATALTGTSGSAPSGPYAFTQLKVDSTSDPEDTMYVANDLGSDIEKWCLDNGTWTLHGTIALTAARGITAIKNGANVDVFVTAGAASGNGITNIIEYVDASGYDGTFSGTGSTLVQLPAGQQFRGVVITTIPEPSTIMLVGIGLIGGLVTVYRRRS